MYDTIDSQVHRNLPQVEHHDGDDEGDDEEEEKRQKSKETHLTTKVLSQHSKSSNLDAPRFQGRCWLFLSAALSPYGSSDQ